MEKTYIRRNFKDSLFRMIFRGKEELLSLYNAVNGSQYKNPEELVINTIDDVIYMGYKNDVSFLIDEYLNLYEAQSQWNPNMPLRGVFYLSRLYQGYIEEHRLDVYSNRRLEIPTPKYIVFYNGLKNVKDVEILRLSDSFSRKGKGEHALECVATLFNINFGHNEKIMKNCRKLYEYSCLIEEIRKGLEQGGSLKKAVEQAIESCIRAGILENFLRKHRAEVKSMILTEYDEEFHIKCEKELSFQDGKAEGKAEAVLELLEELGIVPQNLKSRIMQEQDGATLKRFLKAAARAKSVRQFEEEIL